MEIKDEGVCRFCLKTFSGRGIGKHLMACKAKREADKETSKIKKIQSIIYHIKILGYKIYWLHIEMESTAILAKLDRFLRNIWLECCRHLSEFKIKEVHCSSYPIDDPWLRVEHRLMDMPLNEILGVKDKFEYQYDFGSTTHLEGKVLAERQGIIKEPVRILARNNPLEFQCSQCGKKVTQVCMDAFELLCDRCLSELGYDEDRMLPVVNSPRMGVCGYCGEGDFDDFKVK